MGLPSGAIVATLISLLAPLSSSTRNGQLMAAGGACNSCPAQNPRTYESLPAGKLVHVAWTSSFELDAVFAVYPPDQSAPACYGNASGGSCSFTSSGGDYLFQLSPPSRDSIAFYVLNFTVGYSVPWL
jgi:hypothetical protein